MGVPPTAEFESSWSKTDRGEKRKRLLHNDRHFSTTLSLINKTVNRKYVEI